MFQMGLHSRQHRCVISIQSILESHVLIVSIWFYLHHRQNITVQSRVASFHVPVRILCPGVSLTLCCFVVYSTRRFVVCISVYHFVRVFLDLSVSSSSLGLERAAVCDCGSPWTFFLPFFNCFL